MWLIALVMTLALVARPKGTRLIAWLEQIEREQRDERDRGAND